MEGWPQWYWGAHLVFQNLGIPKGVKFRGPRYLICVGVALDSRSILKLGPNGWKMGGKVGGLKMFQVWDKVRAYGDGKEQCGKGY